MYILALDQGTTSSRAVVVNHSGEVIAKYSKEITQSYPKSGWVEHDPLEIWASQLMVLEEVLNLAKITLKDVAGIGITNQRETTIVWDKDTGHPVYPAIVWQDRRTAHTCKQLKKHESLFRKKTGLVLDPYFSGTKLKWILENVKPEGNLAFGTVDSFLAWKLTGEHVTDSSNASRTLMYNIHNDDWDDELLEIFGIPREILPEVKSSSEVYGEYQGVPVSGIAGDQQAALFGQGCHREGLGKITYGTGSFVLMHTGDKPRYSKNLLTTVACKFDGKLEYALEGSIFIGGAVVQWLRDGLGMIHKSEEIEKLAKEVSSSEGVVFVPAFTGLGAPYWEPNARASIFGMTRGTTKAHIARAALEGIVYQVADILDMDLEEFKVDGGASNNDTLMQMQADLLQVPLLRSKNREVTALGAAYLAGLAVGFWENREEVQELWELEHAFKPKLTKDKIEKMRERWTKAIQSTLMFSS
ncbi:MAG: Glycerol kinase [Chlamydiia bacterium]|nr:Glycerol kinase [Chlamydiia bacterium]MCH9615713.1 Glycerol kinase [Chlamydiia bacterium]MCH9628884.1 Glycerol kinase [Chlamydiia bacterium]